MDTKFCLSKPTLKQTQKINVRKINANDSFPHFTFFQGRSGFRPHPGPFHHFAWGGGRVLEVAGWRLQLWRLEGEVRGGGEGEKKRKFQLQIWKITLSKNIVYGGTDHIFFQEGHIYIHAGAHPSLWQGVWVCREKPPAPVIRKVPHNKGK